MLVAVSAQGSAKERNCPPASTMRFRPRILEVGVGHDPQQPRPARYGVVLRRLCIGRGERHGTSRTAKPGQYGSHCRRCRACHNASNRPSGCRRSQAATLKARAPAAAWPGHAQPPAPSAAVTLQGQHSGTGGGYLGQRDDARLGRVRGPESEALHSPLADVARRMAITRTEKEPH